MFGGMNKQHTCLFYCFVDRSVKYVKVHMCIHIYIWVFFVYTHIYIYIYIYVLCPTGVQAYSISRMNKEPRNKPQVDDTVCRR